MNELDYSKTIDFEIIGDIKPTVKEVLGYYATQQTRECAVIIHGTRLEFPAFKSGVLTYHGWAASETDKKIIKELYDKKLIKTKTTNREWLATLHHVTPTLMGNCACAVSKCPDSKSCKECVDKWLDSRHGESPMYDEAERQDRALWGSERK